MKHLFIVNPVAGGKDKSGEIRSAAEKLFAGTDDSFEIYLTKAPLDAIEEIKKRAVTGEEFRVYSCGGDGTFNECACGAAGFSNVSVAPLPTGTGNDFCRMFGEEADKFRSMEKLVKGKIVPIDLIDCNGRYSANLCSVGFDARVGTNVHKYSGIPLIGGATGYVVSLIVELAKGINTPMRITVGDRTMTGEYALCCVCNGRFYGGGFMPSKDAMPNDGDLDIYIARKMNFPKLAASLGKYMKGRSDEIPDKVIHLHGDSITIEFKEPQVVNIDGEAVFSKKVEMKLIPGALNLIVPDDLKFFD